MKFTPSGIRVTLRTSLTPNVRLVPTTRPLYSTLFVTLCGTFAAGYSRSPPAGMQKTEAGGVHRRCVVRAGVRLSNHAANVPGDCMTQRTDVAGKSGRFPGGRERSERLARFGGAAPTHAPLFRWEEHLRKCVRSVRRSVRRVRALARTQRVGLSCFLPSPAGWRRFHC